MVTDTGVERVRRCLKLSVLPVCSMLALAACGQSAEKTAASAGSSSAPAAGFDGPGGLKIPDYPARPGQLGISLSLSGAGASYGLNAQKSFQVSLTEFNALNPSGINGHPLQLDILDDASDVTKSVAAANQFVDDKDAFVIKLSDNPDAAAQQAAVLNKAKVPIITYAGTADFANSTKWPYLFGSSTHPGNPVRRPPLGSPSIRRFRRSLCSRMARAPNVDFASSILNPLKTSAPNVQVVKTATMSAGTVDPSVAVSQLKSAES